MRLAERRPKRRRSHSAVREVTDPVAIWRLRIEIFHHILPRQLTERPGLDLHQLQRSIHPRQILGPNLFEHVVCESGTAVRTRDRGQAQHLYVRRFEPADHVACVQASHAVRNNVDTLPVSLFLDFMAQFGGTLLY